MKHDHPLRRRPLLKVGVTLLCGELLALAFLRLGVSIPISLGVPLGVALIYLIWPILSWAISGIVNALAKAANTLAGRLRNRRTYRYRLTTLLLVVVLIAAVSAWYGRRLHKVQSERLLLDGKWRLVTDDGAPVIIKAGPHKRKEVIMELTRGTYSIDPLREPKWIDLNHADGTMSTGIYRWEGTKLRVVYAWRPSGATRPRRFDANWDETYFAGGNSSVVFPFGINNWLLERVPGD